jgi:hypothetical protein
MMTFTGAIRWLAAIAFTLIATHTSFAQTKEAAKITSAPLLGFDSAFKGYQPLRDEKMVEWKASNEVVTRIGGWREYAKQTQGAVPQTQPAEKTGTPSDMPPANPHAGHGSKP